ncbi:MAG: DoxX family protein [Acidisphaera sp.]|nr:DoxX family protein [Acidisphaera sp.]
MGHRIASRWFALLGLGFVVAGGDKLLGLRGYEGLFRRLGWSDDVMRLIGAAELTGGALVGTDSARRLGGTILVLSSAAMLAAELRQDEGEIALPRLGLLLASLTALCPCWRRRGA